MASFSAIGMYEPRRRRLALGKRKTAFVPETLNYVGSCFLSQDLTPCQN